MSREAATELLKLCHAYLRGAEINTPQGCNPINPDQLARQINLYLNDNATQEQTHDQDQCDPAGTTDQAAA